jgi:ornithine cyclodeaminase
METDPNRILFLSQRDVRTAAARIDPVRAVREALAAHASGQSVLPAEAYLRWSPTAGESARSLNMPGRLAGAVDVAGTKIINANPANPARGLPRASGLTVLFDPTDARIYCVLDAAHISALRTASVSALSAELFNGNDVGEWALIGAGALARAHLQLLPSTLGKLRAINLFDIEEKRAEGLAREFAPSLAERGIRLQVARSAKDAIRDADFIVTATTVTEGYIGRGWLKPGALLVHVSLDDLRPEALTEADRVVVDDWALVRDDDQRLLGRMWRQGLLTGPGDDADPAAGRTAVHAELGDIIIGRKAGRSSAQEIVIVNPFGLSIEDLAVARQVYDNARQQGLGLWLER